jgi:hypothetical protein
MIDDTQKENEAVLALRAILSGDYPRPIGKYWNPDKRPSKHNQCTHGIWLYEPCEGCLDTFVAGVLAKIDGNPS